MNFVKYYCFFKLSSKIQIVLYLFLVTLSCICVVGCSDQVHLPSVEQLAEFENAGPIRPTVDLNRLETARIRGGPYRVISGEVLDLSMPAILQVVTAETPKATEEFAPYICRVSESGTITLPVVGEIEVAGRSLTEIESAVIDAYYPKYAVVRPSVFARVREYMTARVTVSGAVQKPGIYSLRSDQMSLVALIMEAGSIIDEGAALIRIMHPDEVIPNSGDVSSEKFQGTARKTMQKSSDLDEEVAHILPAHHAQLEQTEDQISFIQTDPQSTQGWLTIKHNEKILLTEKLDITSEIQRQPIYEKLAQRYSYVSTDEVQQKLCTLSEVFKPGSGGQNGQNGNSEANTNSNTKTNLGNPMLNPVLYQDLNTQLLELRDLEKAELSERSLPETIILPVKGLNIPFTDVVLQDGDTVIVEKLQIPLFTVMGLVNNPGNFPYPPDAQYNLVQALGFAGGFNQAAEPRYATVYRIKADGTIASVTFNVADASDASKLTNASNVFIKPSDIVVVEHTPRTRTNLFLNSIFRLQVGAYIPVWNNN